MIKLNIFFGLKLIVCVTLLTIQLPSNGTPQTSTRRQPAAKADYVQLDPGVREVPFTNDLGDVVMLDLVCQYDTPEEREKKWGEREEKCLAHFQKMPVTIRAEKEYHVRNGDMINVETKRSWEVSMENIANDALLSIKTFRKLVRDHLMPNKHITNFMDKYVWKYYNKAKLFVLRKVIARYTTTSITIHTDIEPEHQRVLCSDIILHLEKLNSENMLSLDFEYSLLNTHVTVTPKVNGSLPRAFF